MSDRESKEEKPIRMELKYCEHCGALWTRESGGGEVYCGNCQGKVADLPIPKKKPGRVKMPVRPHALVEDYGVENWDEEETNFEAEGGVA